MTKPPNNYAFVDSQNVVRATRRLGWKLDWHRFRRYLRDRHGVTRAYLFLAFLPEKQRLRAALQRWGWRFLRYDVR